MQGSPARAALVSAKQSPGARTSILAVSGDFDATDERVPVAPGALHNPLSARGKIVNDDGSLKAQVLEVDNIQVGAIARGNYSTVMESVTPSRRHRLLVDQVREWQLRAALPVARPDREQACRRTGIADIPNVGAAVGDTADRVAVYEHLVHDAKIAAAVVLERMQQEIRAVLLQKQLESKIERIAASCSSFLRDAVSEVRLVVQRVAEIERALEYPLHVASVFISRAIFDQPSTELTIGHNTLDSHVVIERLQRLPQAMSKKRMS